MQLETKYQPRNSNVAINIESEAGPVFGAKKGGGGIFSGIFWFTLQASHASSLSTHGTHVLAVFTQAGRLQRL